MIKLLKLIPAVITITLNAALSFANMPDRTNRITFSLGVYQVTSEEVSNKSTATGSTVESPIPTAVANIKISYEVVNNLDIGGYFAYSNMGHKVPLVKNSDGIYVLIDSEGVVRISSSSNNFLLSSNTLFYGLTTKYNLLPVLTGKDNLRFSLYATSKVGLVSAKWQEFGDVDWVKKWNIPFAEFGVGLGAGYNFTKRFGVNFNYSFGTFYNKDNSRLFLGIVFKI